MQAFVSCRKFKRSYLDEEGDPNEDEAAEDFLVFRKIEPRTVQVVQTDEQAPNPQVEVEMVRVARGAGNNQLRQG